jgi:hypothetical protein
MTRDRDTFDAFTPPERGRFGDNETSAAPERYLPMEMGKCGKLLSRVRCPNCGSGPKGIVIAKQDNGVLNEPLGSHQTGVPA